MQAWLECYLQLQRETGFVSSDDLARIEERLHRLDALMAPVDAEIDALRREIDALAEAHPAESDIGAARRAQARRRR